ncbi:MAG: NADPH:quinone oxidoreductase family protein [Alphaproteobacteria bacterium]|nr:NADPH:quinone oxidoreductase family protein [Alphaproteobacteria bacterium]
MKALICRAYGPIDSHKVEDIPQPKPGKGQVLIEVKAAGVNFPDVLIVQGKYQNKPEFPFVPGTEYAGIVREIGEGVSRCKVGDKVVATGLGGFGEFSVAPAENVSPMAEGLDFETAAAINVTYGTTIHALRNCTTLKPGETLLVTGAAGGVGIAAVEIGKLLGARVIAAASSDDKLAVCRERGADEVINYETEDFREGIKRAAGKAGIDVVYDAVGGKYSEPALRSLNWRGRFLVIGFAAGDIPKVPLNLALLAERLIIGVFWGAWRTRNPDGEAGNMAEVAGWIRSGKLKPLISGRYPLSRADQALKDMAARKVQGKIVVVPG